MLQLMPEAPGDLDMQTFGFPPGYFVIRSVANHRVLDVSGDDIEDGAEIVLWPEKETSLVESRRDPEANNQVFFIDTSGALCSRSSGHAIDVEGGKLVLRHRRPVSYPYPNPYAHPLPTFSYSSKTCEITVGFAYDPEYPPPSRRSDAWKNKSYFLTAVPLRKPKSIVDDAAAFLSSAVSTTGAFLVGRQAVQRATPEEVFDGTIDLGEHEVVEEERGEEAEVDDSPELGRKVTVVGLYEHNKLMTASALNRRRWEVASLRTSDARTNP